MNNITQTEQAIVRNAHAYTYSDTNETAFNEKEALHLEESKVGYQDGYREERRKDVLYYNLLN